MNDPSGSLPAPVSLAARIAALRPLTPSVLGVDLDLNGASLPFLAGQWIDLHVELDAGDGGGNAVGGYSITSPPAQQGMIELAVKAAPSHPVTRWLHSRAAVGDPVRVVGGQGSMTWSPGDGGPLMLVAGGIGITPLMSILRTVDADAGGTQATLAYSASTPVELAFAPALRLMAATNARIQTHFTVTGTDTGTGTGTGTVSVVEGWTGRTGRIDRAWLAELLPPEALCYVCGPPAMIDRVETDLRALGVAEDRIRTERWW